MRHRKSGVKLGRTSSHRDAMFRNMVTSLFKYDRIKTTDAKAKELRSWADHMVTLAKRGDLHARRQALSVMREKNVVHKLFEEASERFGSVAGGYTRIVKLGYRAGDAASVSLVELIGAKSRPAKKKEEKKAAEETAAPASAAPDAAPEPPAADEKSEESEKSEAGSSDTTAAE